MKIGSLCTGYGGLDLAAEAYFNAETVWCADSDKYASQVIAQRFNVPNYGDIKTINWNELQGIDILTAGYPCQPFSHAGERKGLDDPRHIFPYVAKAISVLRPRYVVLENVRGHLTLGFDEVLRTLTELGYDVKWGLIRASDIGAPHKRERLFIIANSNSDAYSQPRRTAGSVYRTARKILNWPNRNEYGSGVKVASDTNDEHKPHNRQVPKLGRRFATRREMSMQTPPDALVNGKLNAKFVEYMMGLPAGWVTDCGLSNAQTLKMLGNGVVPQQAELALELLTACG